MLIDSHTKLSEIRAFLENLRANQTADPYAVPERMARSIQQSLRMEGYNVSLETIKRVAEEELRAARGPNDTETRTTATENSNE